MTPTVRQRTIGLPGPRPDAPELGDCECERDPWVRTNSGTVCGRYVIVVYCRRCGSRLAGHIHAKGGDGA